MIDFPIWNNLDKNIIIIYKFLPALMVNDFTDYTLIEATNLKTNVIWVIYGEIVNYTYGSHKVKILNSDDEIGSESIGHKMNCSKIESSIQSTQFTDTERLPHKLNFTSRWPRKGLTVKLKTMAQYMERSLDRKFFDQRGKQHRFQIVAMLLFFLFQSTAPQPAANHVCSFKLKANNSYMTIDLNLARKLPPFSNGGVVGTQNFNL